MDIAEPLSIFIDTYGTSTKSFDELIQIIRSNYNLLPGVIAREVNLDRLIYLQTAKNGDSGTNPSFSWEQPKKLRFSVVLAGLKFLTAYPEFGPYIAQDINALEQMPLA